MRESTSAPEGARIAGFWRRLMAALLDALVLAIPAYILGYQFFDQLAALGQNGRLIGAVVSLLYFGILNSNIGAGQTLGKRWLGVRVVGASGQPIGMHRTVPRALILMLPYYLNGFDLTPFVGSDDIQTVTLIGVVASFVVFGLGGSIIYLYIFNRKTRQSLHDLFVESYVVRAEPHDAVSVRIWPVHVAIPLLLIALSLALPALVQRSAEELVPNETFAALRRVEADIIQLPAIGRASVSTEVITSWSSTKEQTTTSYLVVTAYTRRRFEDADPIILDVARAVLKREPALLECDRLKVVVAAEFDLGIVRATTSTWESGSAEDWRKKVGGQEVPAMITVSAHEDTLTSIVGRAWKAAMDLQRPQ